MARFQVDGLEEIINKLEGISDYDEIAPELINNSLEPLEKEVKNRLNKHNKSGDLAKSVKKQKAQKNQYGWYGRVLPSGKDSNGVRNMEKLAYLEYGTSHQPATPVITPAVNHALSDIGEQMQEKYNEIVGGKFEC